VNGNAQVIAEQIFEELLLKGYEAKFDKLNNFKKLQFEAYKTLIVVCSTTGNGDPPENAELFFRFIKKKTNSQELLKNTKFAVLGLGDTNYDNFCQMGKLIDKQLHWLGGKSFVEKGLADDAVGLESVVEPWKKKLWKELPSVYTGIKKENASFIQPFLKMEIVENKTKLAPKVKQEKNFEAKLIYSEKLTTEKAKNQVLMLEFEVENVKFNPGDSVGIHPQNNPEIVVFLLKKFNVDPELIINLVISDDSKKEIFPKHIQTPSSLFDIFMNLDIDSILNHYQIKILSQYIEDKEELELIKLLLVDDKVFKEEITETGMSIVDFLNIFGSCHPPLEHLFHILPPIAPRYYSIANSPLVDANKIRIAFTLLEKQFEDRNKKGLCTDYLSKLSECLKDKDSLIYIPMFLQPSPEFYLPQKESPLIFIATGAGILNVSLKTRIISIYWIS
jgi:sulfite reductase alpha subunit-like flavoprotein